MTGSIAPLKNDYLADIAAELDKEPEKPKKKTQAQKRAERKELKRLETIENKKLILRDNLRRELLLSKRTEERHIKDWEEMCCEIRIVELREELREWSQSVKQKFESKNLKIEHLLEQMESTMDQQEQLLSKSVELLDYVQRCYVELTKSQKEIYAWQAEDLIKHYYEEMKRRSEELDFMRQNTDNILHAANVIAIDELKKDYRIYQHERCERNSTEIENRFVIRDQIVAKMRQVYEELNMFITELSSTDLDVHKYERIRGLTERQNVFQAELTKLNADELKYRSLIKELQFSLLRNESAYTAAINDLRLELEYFHNVHQGIEREWQFDRNVTHSKLRILTTECYDLIKIFEKYTKKAELLHSLATNCGKMQTESEKVILGGELPPQPIDFGNFDESFKLDTLNLKKHLDINEDDLVEQNKFMRNFWRRQAMVEAQNMLLLEEKRKLTAENKKYINFIKSMTVNYEEKKLTQSLKVKQCADMPRRKLAACTNFKLMGQQV